MKKTIKRGQVLLLGLFAIILVVGIAGQAKADILEFNFDISFGQTPPDGDPFVTPWLTATFDDSYGDTNTVRLTMSAPGLTGSESVNDWYFNFDPNLTLTPGTPTAQGNLTFSEVLSSGVDMGKSQTGPYVGRDAFKADGDGWYDFMIDFPPPPGGGQVDPRFEMGDTVIYDITYTSAIDVNSFNFFSTEGGNQGTYLSAAHIQKTGPNGNDSDWVAVVPEPVSSTLFIVGAATLGFRRYRKRKSV